MGALKEVSSVSSSRQSAVTLLRDRARIHRERAEALSSLARLIDNRGEVFPDEEDPEPSWWALFIGASL